MFYSLGDSSCRARMQAKRIGTPAWGGWGLHMPVEPVPGIPEPAPPLPPDVEPVEDPPQDGDAPLPPVQDPPVAPNSDVPERLSPATETGDWKPDLQPPQVMPVPDRALGEKSPCQFPRRWTSA